MALADYSTSIEKIAALKCAMMDPALVTLSSYGGSLTTTETVYIINGERYMIDGIETRLAYAKNALIIGSAHTISGLYDYDAFFYIKDSDIIYTDPITTYQNRLSYIFSTPQIFSSSVFDIGVNGSLLFALNDIRINKGGTIYIHNSISESVPIPAGETISNVAGVSYLDVPSDW